MPKATADLLSQISTDEEAAVNAFLETSTATVPGMYGRQQHDSSVMMTGKVYNGMIVTHLSIDMQAEMFYLNWSHRFEPKHEIIRGSSAMICFDWAFANYSRDIMLMKERMKALCDESHLFHNVRQCIDFIGNSSYGKVLLIVVGQQVDIFIRVMHDLSSVEGIYVEHYKWVRVEILQLFEIKNKAQVTPTRNMHIFS